MKRLVQILASMLAALLGYAAAGAFRPAAEKPRAAAAPTPKAEAAATSTLHREAGVDLVADVIASFAGEPSLAGLASTLEALERLTPAQMGELLQRTLTLRLPPGVSESERTTRIRLLMRAWTESDPQAATEWMRPRLARYARMPGFGSGYTSAETELVEAWARRAPQLALEIARSYPGSDLGYKLLWSAVFTSLDKDHARRMELLRDFPAGSARQRVTRNLLDSWSRADFPAALAAIGSMPPGTERTETLRSMLPNAVFQDPAGTLTQAEALGMADDPKTVLRLAMAAGDKAPKKTAAWLEAHGPEQIRSAGPALVLAWVKKEPKTAFEWARKHGIDLGASVLAVADNETRDWARSRGFFHDTPMQAAMEAKPEVVLAWLRAQPPGAERDTAVVATLRAMREPERMIPLLAMLPPEAAPQGAEAIAAKFTGMGSSEAGIQWAQALPAGPTRTAAWTALGKARGAAILPPLPPGPDRDALLRGTTQTAYYIQGLPEKAMGRALEITDPQLRRQTFDEVMSSWTTNPKHRESAAPWLNQATVPEAWKTPWRERVK